MDEPASSSPHDWRALVRRRAADGGVLLPDATVDELALHLEDLYTTARANGEPETEAHARALVALSESSMTDLRRHIARDPQRVQQRQADDLARTTRGGSLSIVPAIRMALRQFKLQRSFALVTVLVLGFGTGAATTVFTIVDSVVLRPLPYKAPDRLVTLWDVNATTGVKKDPISPVNFMDYRALPVFEDAAAWWRPAVNLTDPGQEPVRVRTIETSANLFRVLGVDPQLGAGFPSGALFVPNDPVIVISDRLWRTRYSADAGIIGRQLNLNGTPFTVTGVMPPKFHYPDDVDVWQRLEWDMTQHSRSAQFMEAVARMRPATTFEQAQSAVDGLGLRLQRDFPAHNKGWSSRLMPLLDDQLGYYRPALLVLFGAVGLLLLIAVLNVASLLLTRALSRQREIAVRIAMGASPGQLVSHLMAESLVLSVAGAVVGIAAAAAALPLVVRLTPVEIPRLAEASVDWRALAVGLGIVAATTVFFGLVPAAVLLRRQVTTDLKAGERGSSRGARRVYSAIVVAEVALACALLVSSALLVRTVARMMTTPMGVSADPVLTTSVQLPEGTYRSWREVSNTHAAILEEIRRQTGVEAAGAANFLPLEAGWRVAFAIEGRPAPQRLEDAPQAQFHSATDGYFDAMGATLARGRSFTKFDTAESAPVVVVNEAFARNVLSDRGAARVLLITARGIGPLGANLFRLRPPVPRGAPPPPPMPPTRFEIVGVVRDIRNAPLGQPLEPAIYFAARQFPFRELFFAVRARDRAAGEAAVRTALKQVAPTVPLGIVSTWGERVAGRTAEPRLLMTVLMFFAGLAALLAALGVYGLFSWSVALRTRELAIRLTLGARPAGIARLVVRQSVVLVGAGVVAGIILIRIADSALTRVLYEVTATDAGSLLTAGGLLLATALAASVPPALRAMRVDPVEGLRAE